MDASYYIYKLGMVDDEMVIGGFIIAEIVDSGEMVATDTTLCFLYSAFSVEVSFLHARKGPYLKPDLREGQSSGLLWSPG